MKNMEAKPVQLYCLTYKLHDWKYSQQNQSREEMNSPNLWLQVFRQHEFLLHSLHHPSQQCPRYIPLFQTYPMPEQAQRDAFF